MEYFIGIIVATLAFGFVIRFIKNPEHPPEGTTPKYQYALYGIFGCGFGIIAGALVATSILGFGLSAPASFQEKLIALGAEIGCMIVGTLLGMLVAYLFPSKLVIPPSTQEKILEIAKAQEEHKQPTPAQSAIIQGGGFTIIGLLLLWAGYHYNFNLTNYTIGVKYPKWYLFVLPCLAIAFGLYRILYYVVFKIKSISQSKPKEI
jgi:hypothetical protein